jgi:acyl carrier protein
MTTTFDGLRDIIVRDFELSPERLTRTTRLEEIELDSLAVTELVFALEDEFHVTAENTSPTFGTLGDIADYIDGLIAARDAAPPTRARRSAARPAARAKSRQSPPVTAAAKKKKPRRATAAAKTAKSTKRRRSGSARSREPAP